MDLSYSESDVSLSPSQILEKLEMLRQLQLIQRGKLLKQRLDYQSSSEISANITEIVSHFSNSTTYNTFKSLLQSTDDTSNEGTPRQYYRGDEVSPKKHDDLKINYPSVEGVAVLNISQESEFVPNSPVSSRSTTSHISKNVDYNENGSNNKRDTFEKKHISLDEMPILSPKKNFEELIVEKLKTEVPTVKPTKAGSTLQKKQFLKRGEGMARFGLQKNDLKIQNTKSLPWRKKSKPLQPHIQKTNPKSVVDKPKEIDKKINVQIIAPEKKPVKLLVQNKSPLKFTTHTENVNELKSAHNNDTHKGNLSCSLDQTENVQCSNIEKVNIRKVTEKQKHPIFSNKGKTWAAVLTKEQNDFLSQLKQCDYYKNFGSPAKNTDTDTSCCDSISNARHFKEMAEQNLFDLIENKVSHESFNIENSFFNRFINNNNNNNSSGESTPLIIQKCLAANPDLMRLGPALPKRKRNLNSYSEDETCVSECTDCSETCCSVSTCCTCKSTTQINQQQKLPNPVLSKTESECQKKNQNKNNETCQNDTLNMKDKDIINTQMAEMNAKLVATSELLKDRLHELEDEIETFRKENANISKMREEIDMERQKFYEEKAKFEQKFHEEKILSEYYLAEEKEKLTKQKQMYERYVRDMKGRLNKKEKDEVLILKNEINSLKEEIRLKDAKSTSTIARLRNQLKLMEKDKKGLEDEIEKLKKENKRISHSNNVTRRLTNLKYLEQINKKLSNISSRDSKSDIDLDSNVKYKTFEIEQQKNIRKPNQIRTRAKSVPNLNVTSKYAKYFSQKDCISDKNSTSVAIDNWASEEDLSNNFKDESNSKNSDILNDSNNEDNYLEKMYNERFKSISPTSKRSSGSSTVDLHADDTSNRDTNDFFIQKSNSVSSIKKSLSPHDSLSSASRNSASNLHQISHNSSSQANALNSNHRQFEKNSISLSRNKSPVSILSNPSSNSQKPPTVIYNESAYVDKRMIPIPEPIISKTSLTKTSLNPTETRKSDGSKELRFPNGNVKLISADGKYSKFIYYNGDIKENFYDEGRVKYFYAESKTYHTTYPHGLEVLEFPDGQVEKRYKDGSSEIRLPNGSIRYFDPKNDLVREDWRFPDGTSLTVSSIGEKRIIFPNGQIEVHAKDHKRREFPDGTVKLVYGDGTSETRYASGRVRIKDKHGNLIMDSATKVH